MSTTALPGSAPRVWRDGKRYMWPSALAVPVLPIVSYGVASHSGNEIFWWLTPFLIFGVIPVVDGIIGDDGGNPPEELVKALQEDRYYRWMTFLYLPIHFGGLVLGCWAFTRGDLGWVGKLGVVVSLGAVSGIAINTAHELGHKREELERWLSKIALAPSMYGHFYVEHNRGHHVRVATPEDPASARLGESFWAFWPRTVAGSLRSAWHLESKRLRLRGRRVLSWRNEILTSWAMTVVLFGALTAVFGWWALALLVVQGVLGFTLLEVVNYLEHYGLARQRNAAGRYEKVDERHSWNSNRLATNMFLYELQRHSDHHANPTRRYQVLRHFDTSPQLPAGYARMIVLAVVPAVWRRVMDHRVVAHYGGDVTLANLHPPKRAELIARYGTAPGT
jgi:alkane 1-monooxygenase